MAGGDTVSNSLIVLLEKKSVFTSNISVCLLTTLFDWVLNEKQMVCEGVFS